MSGPLVVAFPGNESLAAALCNRVEGTLAPLEMRRFPDGESYLRLDASCAGCTIVVACSLERPDDKLVRLGLLAAHLREQGARNCILVAPYLAYLRQDRAFHAGECVSARHVLAAMSSLFDGLVTVDPHLHRIEDLQAAMGIPVRVVHAAPQVGAWIRNEVPGALVIGPDEESRQWVAAAARVAGVPFAVLDKQRLGDRQVEITLPYGLQLAGRTPVIVDDIVSSASTMIAATQAMSRLATAAPVCVAVHAIFSGDAIGDLERAGAARIVSVNTIAHPTNRIDVAPAIGAAVADLLHALPAGRA
jgi:ribose-phosphate pyrophosphokinase